MDEKKSLGGWYCDPLFWEYYIDDIDDIDIDIDIDIDDIVTLCFESMSCIPIASGWNFWKVGFKVIRQKQLINAEMKDLQLLLFPVPASDFFRQKSQFAGTASEE